MASLGELSFKNRLFLAAYPWRRVNSPPAPLGPPLAAARLALVTSAGLYLPGRDRPFEAIRGGDCSFRWIDGDQDIAKLAIGQRSRSFDRAAMTADRNEAFPLDRLRELVSHGVLGSLASRHPSFSGSITAPGRLVRDTAPAVADALRKDRVDAALLVPV